MILFKLLNIQKTYLEGNIVTNVLKNLNLEIFQGDFISIIGPSGSGKTSLLNIVGLLDSPTSGKLFFKNIDISAKNIESLSDLRRNFGYVFQRPNLIKKLSIFENIKIPLLLNKNKLEIDKIENIISNLLERFDLLSKKYSFPNELSLGEQQRISLLRSIIHSPEMLLLDEPTGSLDYESSQKISDILLDIRKKYNITVLMVTHDFKFAETADKVIKLADGELLLGPFLCSSPRFPD